MKPFLIAFTFLSLAVYGQTGSNTSSSHCDVKVKHKAQHIKKSSSSVGKSATPTSQGTFTPRGSTNKSGIPANRYHNEQDNFKRKDTIGTPSVPQPQTKPDGHSDMDGPDYSPGMNKTEALPAVSFSFSAESCPSNDPPDNTMAISANGDIVSAVNCGIFFYNNAGSLVGQTTYPTFFNTSTDGFSDPRLIYDPSTDRFIFLIQFGHTAATSVLYIAFSNSNDPMGQWHYFSYSLSAFANNVWFDYPSVGINQTDFCVTGNLFDDSGSGVGNLVFLFNKSDGFSNATTPRNTFWTNVQDGNGHNGFTIAPATDAQNVAQYNGTFYLVSTNSSGASYVSLYTITGSAGNSPSIAASVISTIQSYSPSSTATQPNNINLANYKAGCRVQNACYLNGVVHFVFSANYTQSGTSFNSIYYNRINISASSINQNWSFLSGSNYNYPSLASYGNSSTDQTVIIGFLKSDQTTNPEVRFKYFDNNMNQLGSTQIRQGDAAVDYTWAPEQRWGDYTGTQRRYSASQPEIWVGASYGNSNSIWQTYIAQITGYPGTVSVSQVSLDEPLSLYPNPVKNQLYIKGDLKNVMGFPTVYDITGRLVNVDMTRRDNEMFQLDVTTLASGSYIVKIDNNKSIKFSKE
jgi:hypothetical protein